MSKDCRKCTYFEKYQSVPGLKDLTDLRGDVFIGWCCKPRPGEKYKKYLISQYWLAEWCDSYVDKH